MNIAQKFDSKFYFQKGNNSAYRLLSKYPKEFKIATQHMSNPLKHKKDDILAEAKKYNLPYHFQVHSKWAYCAAQQYGWLKEACAHMDTRFIWDQHSAFIEAKKYKNKKLFRNKSRGAYNFLNRLGKKVLDKACTHMEQLFRWTPKLAIAEAKTHTNRQSLRKANPGCMVYICKHKLIDKAFSHMEEVIILAEKKYQKEFEKELRVIFTKNKLQFVMLSEFGIKIGQKSCRVDLFIRFTELNKSYAVEFKADSSYWNKVKIEDQRKMYHKHLKKHGVKKTFLVSPNGKYGISSKEFIKQILKEIKSGL